jgi:hypothetical protein
VWALGNIAGDNYGYRDIVNSHGAVEPLVNILKSSVANSSMTRNASWTLSNLVRGKPKPEDSIVFGGLPSLAKVIKENENEDILTDVCWALSYISDQGEDRIPYIIET